MRVGIVGCGIAGQATGIALARAGHDVSIFERFPEVRPVGAGLLLQPSGQEALAQLGLLESARTWGEPIARLYGRTTRGRMVMDLRYEDCEAGAFGLGIHRAALFHILYDALARSSAKVFLDFEVSAIATPDAPRIVAQDGREEGPFDLVIDCAGAHDQLRRVVSASFTAREYLWGALWTTCADRRETFAGELRQVYRGASTMIGVLPIGRVPDESSGCRHVAFFWSVKHGDFAELREKGLDSLKAKILTHWPEVAPILEEIPTFDAFSLAAYRDVRLPSWHRGRVLALGDAAHATSPQLGQGANLALIDAVMLAYALNGDDIDAALSRFVRTRRAHVNYYQLGSRALTPFFQSDSRLLGFLRDLLLGPIGRLPVIDQVMRTTLSGVRMFPFGLFHFPPSGAKETTSPRDRAEISDVAQEQ